MNRKVLKVRMLGTFTMEYDGRPISLERNSLTKTNQLLQILFQAGEEGISREQLLLRLFGREEVTNPANSLRATVFRLRKLLAEAGLPEWDEFVHIKSGVYRWTSQIPVELDTILFEEQMEMALAETDENRRFELLRSASELYLGDFLSHLSTKEWVVVCTVKYKELYIRCMRELCERLKQRGEYAELYLAAGYAAKLYPFDEWQVWQIDSLIAQKKIKEAMQLYEETADYLFREMGISPSKQMMERLAQMNGEVEERTEVIEEIQDYLEEKGDAKGAYYCSYPSFSESYKYMKRVIERTGQSAYLLLCTITDGKGFPLEKGERLEHLVEELQEAVRTALRRGDLYTQYSKNQLLILLLDLKLEDCQIVIDRINKRFESPSRKNYLKYHVSSLRDVKTVDDTLSFNTSKNMWD